MPMKKIAIAFAIILALIVGFLIGWRATILNGNISVDEANGNIGYFECWGRVDQYFINN